jgi:UDP-N-acetylmuramate--alanine ligase
VLVLFQPHLFSRTRHLAQEFGAALAGADAVAVTDVYRAREEPIEGVTGKLVVDAVADARPGMVLAWTPTVEEGARFVAAQARAGDRVLTLGAGDVDRAAELILEALG